MECSRCKTALGSEAAVSNGAEVVCEDCLMDLLSPAKACDPWAVKLAKGAMATSAEGDRSLRGLEKDLLELVRARGAVPKPAAPGLLEARPAEVERAFSVLRHMELLRARRVEGGAPEYVLFDAP